MILSRRLDQHAATAAAVGRRPGRTARRRSASRSCTPTPMSAPICRIMSASTTPSRARMPTLNQILRPWWGKLLVGMRYLLTARRPAVAVDEPWRRLLPHRPVARRGPTCSSISRPSRPCIPKGGERPILTPDPWPGFSIGLSNCRPIEPRRDHDPLDRSAATIRRSSPTPIRPSTMSPRCWRR